MALIHRLHFFQLGKGRRSCRIVAGSHAEPEAPKKNRITSAWFTLRQYLIDLTKPKAPKKRPANGVQRPPAEPCPPCPPGTPIPVVEVQEGLHTRFARLFFGVITLLVLYYSYLIIKPYLLDIFMALVLFFTAKPLYRALTRLLRGWKALASALTCLILLLVILIPLFSLMSIIATQALEFSSQVTKGMQYGDLWNWVSVKIDALKLYLIHLNLPVPPGEINLAQIVQTTVTKASAFVYTNAIGLIRGFTVFFFDLVLTLFIAFFMFLQGDDFIQAIKGLSPLDPAHNDEILRETETTIKATLWGTVIVAVAQGALGGVGFLIFGLPQPAFWGTVMIPASVIPVVGSTIIWGPAAVYLLLTGKITRGGGADHLGRGGGERHRQHLKAHPDERQQRNPQHLHPVQHPGRPDLFRHDRLYPGAPDPVLSPVAAAHLSENHPGAGLRPPEKSKDPPPRGMGLRSNCHGIFR